MGILSSIKEKIFGTPDPGSPAPAETATEKVEPVDVEAVLEKIVKAKGLKLDWRGSIVDFLKALDLDCSLAARKELAVELKYVGTDSDGSAKKNTWLLKMVMRTLAECGGKVPKKLLK